MNNKKQFLLNFLYDRMIAWNISKDKKRIPIWNFLEMSAKEYNDFSLDPEKWADNCFENFRTDE